MKRLYQVRVSTAHGEILVGEYSDVDHAFDLWKGLSPYWRESSFTPVDVPDTEITLVERVPDFHEAVTEDLYF